METVLVWENNMNIYKVFGLKKHQRLDGQQHAHKDAAGNWSYEGGDDTQSL